MLRRLEPTYPSFSLVMNEALDDPFHLPPYQPYTENHPYGSEARTRLADPLMTTIDYRYDHELEDPSVIPELPRSDFWPANPEAANLQAALEGRATARGSLSRRRRFSDLVINLAHTIKKCSVNRFWRKLRMDALKIQRTTAAREVDLTS